VIFGKSIQILNNNYALGTKPLIKQNPNEIKVILGSADLIGNGMIILNSCGNHYRLIAQFNYEKHLVFILFIGTHREYDNLDINNL